MPMPSNTSGGTNYTAYGIIAALAAGVTTVVVTTITITTGLFAEGAGASTPASGKVALYAKSADKKLYYKDSTGTETGPLGSAGVTSFNSRTGAVTPAANDYGVSQLSGAGTGVLAALGVNIGSAGAPVLFNGALGTPTSGDASNLTGSPTFSALTVTTINGGYTPQYAFRTATQTVSDTTTLASDNTLSITVVAGGKYIGRWWMSATTVSGAGMKWDLAGGDATFTTIKLQHGLRPSANSGWYSPFDTGTSQTTAANTAVGATMTGSTTGTLIVDFSCVVNAGGTVIPRFAQNVESGAAESVIAGIGTYLVMQRVP